MWRTGVITADALYFQEGMNEWQPISQIWRLLDPPPLPGGASRISNQPPKNPGAAAVLSFFLPGLGQIYNGQIGLGIGAMLATLFLYLLIIPGLICHVICVIDAYQNATKINEAARG